MRNGFGSMRDRTFRKIHINEDGTIEYCSAQNKKKIELSYGIYVVCYSDLQWILNTT
jgi:hypothetical protein